MWNRRFFFFLLTETQASGRDPNLAAETQFNGQNLLKSLAVELISVANETYKSFF